jgi:hypothetical protein
MSHAARPSNFGFQTTLVEGTLRYDGREWTGCAELHTEPRTGAAIGIQGKKEPFVYSTTVCSATWTTFSVTSSPPTSDRSAVGQPGPAHGLT